MERYIAIDNVCGWPKLTKMDDGSLNLNVHNRPSHGSADGSAECWKSTDGGLIFEKIGVSAEGSLEKGPFIDKACGTAFNGDYIVMVERRPERDAYIFRSADGGRTYEDAGMLCFEGEKIIPYGRILKVGNKLAVSYWFVADRTKRAGDNYLREAHIRFSSDDGKTWDEDYFIGGGINETALLFYNELEGIALGRSDEMPDGGDPGNGLQLYRTSDGGRTWQWERSMMGHQTRPADLTLLSDGSTLLTSGFRYANMDGVVVTASTNRGRSWSDLNILVHFPGADGGYPSTVQLDDGTLVTAYYAGGNCYHTRYYVGVIRWRPEDMTEARWVGRPAMFSYGTENERFPNWSMT